MGEYRGGQDYSEIQSFSRNRARCFRGYASLLLWLVSGFLVWQASEAWACLYNDPNGTFRGAGIGEGPVFLYVVVLTPAVIWGLWASALLLVRKLVRGSFSYFPTIIFFSSSVLVLSLASIGALIWGSDSASVLRISGNLAGVSLLMLLVVVKIRSGAVSESS